jgi:hypothetical protein
MKLKISLFLVCLLFSKVVFSQAKYIIKADMVTKIAMFSTKSKVITYFNNEDVKQLTDINGVKLYQFFIGKKVNLVTIERGFKDVCGEGTLDEWKQLNTETAGTTTYKDLKIEKSDKTEKILGYQCKKCIITCKAEVPITKAEMMIEQEIWYSEELYEKGFQIQDPKDLGVTNPLVQAVADLKGFVLKSKIKQSYGSVEYSVTQIEKDPVQDPIMPLEQAAKDCKKMRTLKEHNEEVQGRHTMNRSMGY